MNWHHLLNVFVSLLLLFNQILSIYVKVYIYFKLILKDRYCTQN